MFMGYLNPARSSTAGVKLDTVGSGHRSFKGLVNETAPLKMITYGVVNYSNLAQASEVRTKKVMFVKSINVFPLPGEWERTVGFFGTCAKVSHLIFSPYRGALPYATRMLPAPDSAGMVCLVLGSSFPDYLAGKL
jgi:hypothetical protein